MNCKNCKTELNPKSDYCNKCGAKVIRNKLTLKNLITDFTQQYLDYDNKFLQTFLTLFTKPEAVIGCYINGTRKRYVNVISYFAIAITLSGLQIFVMKKYGVDFSTLTSENTVMAAQQQQMNSKIFEVISEYQSIIMMLYIPIYAIIAKLIWFGNKTYNYTELIVIFMYAQAQYSIVVAVLTFILIPLGVPMIVFGLLLLPIQIGYFAFCLKRVYSLNMAQIILKTLIFLIILGVLIGIVGIIMAVIMYLNGDFQKMVEAQKAAIEAKEVIKDSIN